MTAARDFPTDYSPGGLTEKAEKRARARWAGKCSGRARRRQAWARRGHPGPMPAKIKFDYELRMPTRREFDGAYAQVRSEPDSAQGLAQWLRGRETSWELLVGTYRLITARGQYCDTTKPRRAAQLAARSRERCTRTVQRHMRLLEQMGYVTFAHHRSPAGQKDYLVVQWTLHRRIRSIDVLHPPGTENPSKRGILRRSRSQRRPGDDALTASAPPTSSADDQRPHEGANIKHREEEWQRALDRRCAQQEPVLSLPIAARRDPAAVRPVHPRLCDGRRDDERRRGELGLREMQGGLPPADGRPATQRERPEDARGVLRGDALGGGAQSGQLADLLAAVTLEVLRPGRDPERQATPAPEHAQPPRRG